MEFNACKMKAVFFEITCECKVKRAKVRYMNKSCIISGDGFPLIIRDESNINKVLRKLRSDNFIGCSCVIILINVSCKCRVRDIYTRLCKAITDNETLKFVTKFFISLNFHLVSRNENTLLISSMQRNVDWKYKLPNGFKKKNLNAVQLFYKYCFPTKRFRKQFLVDITSEKDEYPLNNLIHLRFDVFEGPILAAEHEPIPVQELFKDFLCYGQEQTLQEIGHSVGMGMSNVFTGFRTAGNKIYHSSSVYYFQMTAGNGGCYLNHINPALGVIIYNRKVKGHSEREGGEYDIGIVPKTFDILGIPYLKLCEGSAEEVRHMMSKLKNINFRDLLEYLYPVLMSHGEQGGTMVASRTEAYSIEEDVIAPLLANKSMAKALKCLLIQICRGKLGSAWEDHPDDFIYKPTDTQTQDSNLVKWFATIPDHVAVRDFYGCPVIHQFCNKFKNVIEEVSLEKLENDVEKALLNEEAYANRWKKITELCVRPNTTHTIRNEFVNRRNFRPLIRELYEFTKSDIKNGKHINTKRITRN